MNAARVWKIPSRRAFGAEEYRRYLPLVERTVMSFARRVPAHVSIADLTGYAWVGVLEASARAHPDMDEEEVAAYILYRVRGAILDHLRSLDPVSRRGRTLCRKLAKATEQASRKQGGGVAADEEIAAELGVSMESFRHLAQEVAQVKRLRLERVNVDDVDAAADAAGPDVEAQMSELRSKVAQSIEALSARQREVFDLYYRKDHTFREIGVMLGVTESRVCQIHGEAIRTLRRSLALKP